MYLTKFSLSIVSHRHKHYVTRLLKNLALLKRRDFEVVLTFNVPEELDMDIENLSFPVKIVRNSIPKGFAENHNAAFKISESNYFVILNPDVIMIDDPFEHFLNILKVSSTNICAPLIVNQYGMLEDSARSYPSPLFLIKKLISRVFKTTLPADIVAEENNLLLPDWVAGMFIVVPSDVYEKLGGLNTRYRMYYEDVDFCARARLAGYNIVVSKQAKAIHEAQRDSHRKLRYSLWHLQSAFRFFTSKTYLKIQLNRLLKI